MKIDNNGRGKRKEQRKRRRKRLRGVPKTKNLYWCIDGNYTNHPVAYCTFYHGVVTKGLIDTHHCTEKCCARLRCGDVYE